MVNEDKLVVTWLRAALPSVRVWTGDLPKGFSPASSPGVTVFVRAGQGDPDIPEVINASIQIKVWAKRNGYQVARDLYGDIYGVLHAKNNVDFGPLGFVLKSFEEQRPQDVTDPDTGWATTVGFFALTVRLGDGDEILVNDISIPGFGIQVNGVDV